MRRRSRECALQILYQMDVARHFESSLAPERLTELMNDYWTSFDSEVPVDRDMTDRLVRGVAREVAALDSTIAGVSQHWRLGRMSAVDRNLIRIAAYEIMHCPDIPRAVSINEAVEIAKRFSGAESAAFINGVLDQLQRPSGLGEESDDRQ
jgi:transcription antitermination protein NusB